MNTLQKIFEMGAGSYRSRFDKTMPPAHRRTLFAMEHCRTEEMGTMQLGCPRCGKSLNLPRACSNRHCPTCQHDKGEKWLETNSEKLLPCTYFMVTFTVPENMRRPMRDNQRMLYAALFKAAWESMVKLAKDKRWLGVSTLGAVAVLHTWTRQVEHHPHVHFLVPAGGLDGHGNWVNGRQDFFLPVRALSAIFKAKMRDAIKKLGLENAVPKDVWNIAWNVNCENKGNGVRALAYLSNYLFKVAISNNRIVRADENSVTFRYKKQKSDKFKNMTVSTEEFIRRFLQHVLPSGFVKVRHYGLLASNGKHDLEKIAAMIFEGFTPPKIVLNRSTTKQSGAICSCCGTAMKFVALLPPKYREEVALAT